MEREEKMIRRKYRFLGIGIWILTACIVVGITSAIGYSVWEKYRNNIIQKQEEQMLIIAESLANSLEEMITQYELDLNKLTALINTMENQKESILLTYIESEREYIKNAGFYQEDGEPIWELTEMNYVNIFDVCQMQNHIIMTEKKASDDLIYFILQKKLENETYLELTIDVKAYYEKMLASIQVGTNGYIVVKNEEGYLFMHPVEEQLGQNVIEGREAMYSEVDLKSLKKMIQQQVNEKTGVSEYYSYWWSDDSLPRVKKIAAFSHSQVGDHFLIVSAVMDYDDIYAPIIAGFRVITITFGGILFVLLLIAGVFSYLAVESKKNKNEIAYLKDLNKVLEETRRGEEAIAHQQRLQIMGTMTGGIAHEFNNLLTPIMGYSEMLMTCLSVDSEEYDYANEILDASEKAKDIIHQISSLSRKNMETVYSFVTIRKTLIRSIKMIKSVCPANIQIEVENEFQQEGFLGNETQLNQVLLNICVNAFHAIGKKQNGIVKIKGCCVKKEQIEKQHQMEISKEWENFLCISIEDNGCGMEREVLEQIFNPFFTTKATGKGTGLGLSVAEQIIHSHKGYVYAKSQVEVGTIFFIYLPQVEKSQAISEKERKNREESKLKILVIDDNGKILQLLERKFNKLGIYIHTVSNTEEANQELKEQKYNVLLIDQELSRTGNDDTGIFYAMTIQSTYPELIKIIMTDQIKREIIEAKQHGYIDGYLEKPVSDSQIIEEIYRIQKP